MKILSLLSPHQNRTFESLYPCLLYTSVMLGAFLGTEATIEAAAACCSFIGLCGEAAAEKTKECQGGTMTFRNVFIDEVSLKMCIRDRSMDATFRRLPEKRYTYGKF